MTSIKSNQVILLNQYDLENQGMLSKIQGNILKSHGRHHTANLFISGKPGRQEDVKNWLSSLVDEENGIIVSTYKQLRQIELFKEKDLDSGLFSCVHFSAQAYRYLFGPEGIKNKFKDKPFLDSMKKSDLNDPLIEEWETGFQGNEIHFMLLIADSDVANVINAANKINSDIEDFAGVLTVEFGDALLNAEGAGLEHFGYVDGVSQPLFFEDELEAFKKKNDIFNPSAILYDPSAEKELVLINDPFAGDPEAFGSYLVFRKLEQDVRGFKDAEEKLAENLGLSGEDIERAGALLVGRFEDGTPVQLRGEAGMINSAEINNFDYDARDGSKCPFHAHIRKSNPRSHLSGGIEEAKKHVMARRGIPYGKREDGPNDGIIKNKPTGGVGLLFMSYQASIENQFEFIQRNWVNNLDFPRLNGNNKDGLDPILGKGTPPTVNSSTGEYPQQWGNTASVKTLSFESFVTMKGGEYFFAPSLPFLRSL